MVVNESSTAFQTCPAGFRPVPRSTRRSRSRVRAVTTGGNCQGGALRGPGTSVLENNITHRYQGGTREGVWRA
jgi:hypothetical protein